MPADIVFLELDSLPKRINLQAITAGHHLQTYANTEAEQVLKRIQNANIVVVNKIILDKTILSACPNLKMIAVSATGISNIDKEYCDKHGIIIKNITGYAQNTVAEHTIMLLLTLQRNLLNYYQDVNAGKWAESNFFFYGEHEIVDLHGLTIGIIGSGEIGRQVAYLATAFGMKVNFLARKNQAATNDKIPFEEGIKNSDVISIHCPLNQQTENLIAQKEFAMMKKNAILINTARGGIIDEKALIEAIQKQQIKGVALDVVSTEPMPSNHSLNAIANMPNVIITPHCAWISDNALNKLTSKLIDNINQFLSSDLN